MYFHASNAKQIRNGRHLYLSEAASSFVFSTGGTGLMYLTFPTRQCHPNWMNKKPTASDAKAVHGFGHFQARGHYALTHITHRAGHGGLVLVATCEVLRPHRTLEMEFGSHGGSLIGRSGAHTRHAVGNVGPIIPCCCDIMWPYDTRARVSWERGDPGSNYACYVYDYAL